MLRRILGTVGTRYLVALLNLALIFVNAKALGVEGMGTVGLILASVNIAVIFNGIFAGNTLVYFMRQYPVRMLWLPAYGWTAVGSAAACAVMGLTGLTPRGYLPAVCILAALNSLVAAHARFLLGKDHVKGFNLTYAVQGGLLFFVLLAVYYGAGRRDVEAYLWGAYAANGAAYAVSLLLLAPAWRREKGRPQPAGGSYPKLIREMFAYGIWAGVDNLAETLTTRLNYFFVQRFAGLAGVGILDAGSRISESVWHISRSAGFITYAEVAKAAGEAKRTRVALQLFRFTFVVLVFVVAGILCIPERVYTNYLFSPEFAGMRRVIIALSPGIVALGGNSILSHFFIGSGRVRLSAASSLCGLLTLCLAGYLLVPAFGVVGGAAATSIAFVAMLIFSLAAFIRVTGARGRDFLPKVADFRTVLTGFCRKK